jgi:predicted outer membrane repeat protein
MRVRRVLAWSSAAVLTAALLAVDVTPVSATTVSVATETQYRDALTALSGDNTGPHVIEVTADIVLDDGTGDPSYTGTRPLTVNGNGHTIDAGGNNRVLRFATASPLLTINDLTLTGGTDTDGGGAIRAFGSVSVNGSTFTGNTGPNGDGGAIWADGSVSANNSTFTNNTATNGGAIDAGGAVTVTGSTFAGNVADVDGGAIAATNDVSVTNSTVTGNSGNIDTGAIDATGRLALTYTTVASNGAAPSGEQLEADELVAYGSVVADGQGPGTNCEVSGTTTSNGYDYSDDASCAFTGTGDTQNGADPQLLALGDFGGPTQTRPPAVTSPLVDAIPVAACDPTVTTDQRGLPRPSDGNDDGTDGCDIGAVELQATPPPPSPPTPAAPTAGPVAARPTFTG